MKNTPRYGFILLMIILVAIASSCASGRPPYRQYKPKRPGGCDCSRWSYNSPAKSIYFNAGQENASGRA